MKSDKQEWQDFLDKATEIAGGEDWKESGEAMEVTIEYRELKKPTFFTDWIEPYL